MIKKIVYIFSWVLIPFLGAVVEYYGLGHQTCSSIDDSDFWCSFSTKVTNYIASEVFMVFLLLVLGFVPILAVLLIIRYLKNKHKDTNHEIKYFSFTFFANIILAISLLNTVWGVCLAYSEQQNSKNQLIQFNNYVQIRALIDQKETDRLLNLTSGVENPYIKVVGITDNFVELRIVGTRVNNEQCDSGGIDWGDGTVNTPLGSNISEVSDENHPPCETGIQHWYKNIGNYTIKRLKTEENNKYYVVDTLPVKILEIGKCTNGILPQEAAAGGQWCR